MHYPSFTNLNKFKVSAVNQERSEIETINFVECYTAWPTDGSYPVTNIGVETLIMHI